MSDSISGEYLENRLPADQRSLEQRLSSLKLNEFQVFLFIMVSTKAKNEQQPSLFVKYIYYLNDNIGWTTPYGPLRRFLAEDYNPKSEKEHNESEMWLVEHGLKEQANIQVVEVEGVPEPIPEHEIIFLECDKEHRIISEYIPPKQVSQPDEEGMEVNTETPLDIEVDYDPDDMEKGAQPTAPPFSDQTTSKSSSHKLGVRHLLVPPPEFISGTKEFEEAKRQWEKKKTVEAQKKRKADELPTQADNDEDEIIRVVNQGINEGL